MSGRTQPSAGMRTLSGEKTDGLFLSMVGGLTSCCKIKRSHSVEHNYPYSFTPALSVRKSPRSCDTKSSVYVNTGNCSGDPEYSAHAQFEGLAQPEAIYVVAAAMQRTPPSTV